MKIGTRVWFVLFGARVKGTFLGTFKDTIEVFVNGKKLHVPKSVRLGKIL